VQKEILELMTSWACFRFRRLAPQARQIGF